jgi:hypothetical protein
MEPTNHVVLVRPLRILRQKFQRLKTWHGPCRWCNVRVLHDAFRAEKVTIERLGLAKKS